MMVYFARPPAKLRMNAPMAFQPTPGRSRHDVMAAFRAYQVQYIDRLHQANGLDLARARVTSPVARFVKMPLGPASPPWWPTSADTLRKPGGCSPPWAFRADEHDSFEIGGLTVLRYSGNDAATVVGALA